MLNLRNLVLHCGLIVCTVGAMGTAHATPTTDVANAPTSAAVGLDVLLHAPTRVDFVDSANAEIAQLQQEMRDYDRQVSEAESQLQNAEAMRVPAKPALYDWYADPTSTLAYQLRLDDFEPDDLVAHRAAIRTYTSAVSNRTTAIANANSVVATITTERSQFATTTAEVIATKKGIVRRLRQWQKVMSGLSRPSLMYLESLVGPSRGYKALLNQTGSLLSKVEGSIATLETVRNWIATGNAVGFKPQIEQVDIDVKAQVGEWQNLNASLVELYEKTTDRGDRWSDEVNYVVRGLFAAVTMPTVLATFALDRYREYEKLARHSVIANGSRPNELGKLPQPQPEVFALQAVLESSQEQLTIGRSWLRWQQQLLDQQTVNMYEHMREVMFELLAPEVRAEEQKFGTKMLQRIVDDARYVGQIWTTSVRDMFDNERTNVERWRVLWEPLLWGLLLWMALGRMMRWFYQRLLDTRVPWVVFRRRSQWINLGLALPGSIAGVVAAYVVAARDVTGIQIGLIVLPLAWVELGSDVLNGLSRSQSPRLLPMFRIGREASWDAAQRAVLWIRLNALSLVLTSYIYVMVGNSDLTYVGLSVATVIAALSSFVLVVRSYSWCISTVQRFGLHESIRTLPMPQHPLLQGIVSPLWFVVLCGYGFMRLPITRYIVRKFELFVREKSLRSSAVKQSEISPDGAEYWLSHLQSLHAEQRPYVDEAGHWQHIQSKLTEFCDGQPVAPTAIVGRRGAGKSTLAARIQSQDTDPTVILLSIDDRISSQQQLLDLLCTKLELPACTSIGDLCDTLLQQRRIVVLDDIQHTILRRIGGATVFDAFVEIMQRTAHAIYWVVTCDSYMWAYIDRIKDHYPYFTDICTLTPWSQTALQRHILHLSRAGNLQVQFGTDGQAVEAEDEEAFFRILHDFCDGYPGAGIYMWCAMLAKLSDRPLSDSSAPIAVAVVLRTPESLQLETQADLLVFGLAAVLQHDGLAPPDLADVLNISKTQAYSVRKMLLDQRLVDIDAAGIMRVSQAVYRQSEQYLRGKHLLAKVTA